ncbi:MAG TPA: NAD(P)-dependent oxidoreductase [Terrimesophilobacter sp.]|nr:NAD(P)-dependent oxidoreductase [Terrimesophilobacter sp.]HRP99370.1 NAD(P)-dependent oxidoreductase [Terrimesophilobacter sp.]
MKVLAGWHATPAEVDRIRTALPVGTEVVTLPGHDTVSFPYGANRAHYREAVQGADAIITWVLPTEIAEAATDLKYVSWLHSGCDRLPFDLFRERGVILTNLPDAHQPAIAEQAWALLLASAKKVVWKHQQHVAGRFVPYWREEGVGRTLYGSTLLVVGLGGIGSRLVAFGNAFGMRVIGVRRNAGIPVDGVSRVYGEFELHEALSHADYTIVAVPSTSRSRGMFDAAALAAMRKSSILVNIARGDIVVEEDIHDALTSGHIGAFSSDVWWDYEDAMPPDQHFGTPSRLGVHLLDNVIVSGDQGSNVFFARETMLERGIENLAEALSSDQPRNIVDLNEQY